ncbi:MAG: hypothetical protein HY901_07820 [Deltaproteobacteria bacterium]|nr:hypothetical protein [Deltaproteobacteria bacterium]
MLMTDSRGRTYRWDDRLTEALREVERQLAEREGRRPRRDGLLLIDTRAHPDLAAAKERAFDEAAERYRSRPPLQVKTGDWVRIGGYRFRIGNVSEKSGLVETERVGRDGAVVSSVPADGAGLVSDPSTEPEPADGLRPPYDIKEAHTRARFFLKAHERALGDRWID